MVHPWRGLRTLAIPLRYCTNVYHDVSQHPFDRRTRFIYISPQQPLVG